MDTPEFVYATQGRYFAMVNEGLEELAAAEFAGLGATAVRPVHRGVHFEATGAGALDLLLGSRLAGRILAPLLGFDCHSSRYLHRRTMQIPWEELITAHHTVAVTATLANSRARHSQFVALKVKDALCDRMRQATGARPSVERHHPDLRVHVHLEGDFATISVDLGDGARHRRGYRPEAGEAPLPETVAAAVLEAAGWEGDRPLLDPMCGSGTLLAEAVLRAGAIAPGWKLDRVGARRLPGFGDTAFEEARRQWRGRARPIPDGLIRGNDSDAEVLATAADNLGRIPGGEDVRLRRGDFRDHPGLVDGLVVCNPPWGLRLGDPEAARDLVRDLGDFLKHRCSGSRAWLVLGDRELLKHVGLRTARRLPVRIGSLDARLAAYELY